MPRIFTDEWRQKLSAAQKARVQTPEGKATIQKMQKARPATVSEETRAKISQAGKGRVQSEETKRKRVLSRTGYQHSDETKAKIRQAHTGLVQSDEVKAKISAAGKGRKQSPEHIAARVAARKAKTDGKWFNSPDISQRISEGKKQAFAELTEEEKEPIRERARQAGKTREIPRMERTCEVCPNLLDKTQKRFCSMGCRNKVIKPYQNGYVKQGEERPCGTCGTVKFFSPSQLKDVNYCSPSCTAKARTGEKNSNWRNGATPKNKILRDTPEGRAWKTAVLTRDGYRCQGCGATDRLDAHHIKPFAKHHELRFDVTNGITLCRSCHESVHGHRIGKSTGQSRVDIECALPGCDIHVKVRRTKVKTRNFCSRPHANIYQGRARMLKAKNNNVTI